MPTIETQRIAVAGHGGVQVIIGGMLVAAQRVGIAAQGSQAMQARVCGQVGQAGVMAQVG